MPPRDRNESSPPPPPPPLEPEDQHPQAIIVPTNLSEKDREAMVRSLYKDHGEYIVRVLIQKGDVQPASAEDIRQDVILIVCGCLAEHAAEGGEDPPPEQVRALVREVTSKTASEHRRERGRRQQRFVLRAGDGDADDAPSSAMDPEGATALAQHKATVARCLDRLSPQEADVVRAIDLGEMTLDEAAKKLGRPRGTVSTVHRRAREKIREMLLAERR